jgi:hypothetical protein
MYRVSLRVVFPPQRTALALPDNTCAALLHEQSAFQFLHQPTPGLRQFGLELVAAGSKFCEVGQLRHGLRCLLTAYSLYEVPFNPCAAMRVRCVRVCRMPTLCHTQNRGWGGIGDSLHIKLARYSFLVGNHERCLAFFQKLFSDCHQPPPAELAAARVPPPGRPDRPDERRVVRAGGLVSARARDRPAVGPSVPGLLRPLQVPPQGHTTRNTTRHGARVANMSCAIGACRSCGTHSRAEC